MPILARHVFPGRGNNNKSSSNPFAPGQVSDIATPGTPASFGGNAPTRSEVSADTPSTGTIPQPDPVSTSPSGSGAGASGTSGHVDPEPSFPEAERSAPNILGSTKAADADVNQSAVDAVAAVIVSEAQATPVDFNRIAELASVAQTLTESGDTDAVSLNGLL